VLSIGFITPVLFAQSASLSGIISEKSSAEALQGANVALTNLEDNSFFYGGSTDHNGFYSIRRIRPGEYKMEMSFLGFVSYTDTLVFQSGERKNFSYALEEAEVGLDELIVEQTASATELIRGAKRISPVELSRVPTPAAGGDLVSYLQVMPGVVSLGNRGGQVFVRGGLPSENMVLVDGAVIFKPFHIMSFFSPFPDNIVSNADFYPGGFGAEYNGRTSSVLDISMKNGDRFDYSGSASLSPFLGDVSFQGPIKKGESSIIVSAKQSFIEESSSWYLSEVQPVSFSSQFVKFSKNEDLSQCSGLFMRTDDRGSIDAQSDERIEWSNTVVGGKCEAVNKEYFVRLAANVSGMQNASIHPEREYRSSITQFKTSLDLSWYKEKIRMDVGVFAQLEWMKYNLRGSVSGLENNEEDPISKGGYFQLMIPFGEQFTIEPGISLSNYPQLPWSIEPRVRMKYVPFGENGAQINAAVGIYRQMVIGITDQRDATGSFVTWATTPFKDELPETHHYLLGWQHPVSNKLSYSAEIFYKTIRNSPIAVWNTVAQYSTELSLADGRVYGVDVRMEYQNETFYGLISYGYTNTEYSATQENFGVWFGESVVSYNPAHDRRHQINALVSKTINKITYGLRWQYGSGIPFTRPIGFDEIIWFDDGLPDVTSESGTSRVLIDRPFTGRFPSYHSLDLSIERIFDLGPKNLLLGKIGAINMYDRSNIFYYDLYTQQRVDQLPFTIYASIKLEIN
jgi:hypothetical protein